MRNLITDVAGVRVGHAGDARLGSGVTAVVFDEPAIGSIDVRGGGPGTRETALLDPAQTVSGIDAIALSGGSAFGLDAASGVQAFLREQGRGFAVRTARVPIVPGAILFDLLTGGDKDWGRYPPYRELGYDARKRREHRFRARQRRRGTRRQHRQSERRARLGLGGGGWHHRRRARRGECRRQRHRGRQPAFLGGALRTAQGIRRRRTSSPDPPRGTGAAHQRQRAARAPHWSWLRPTPSSPRRRPSASR